MNHQETAAEFADRITTVAAKTGIKIKSFSNHFAANFIRSGTANTVALSDAVIAERMIAMARAHPDQVILLKPMEQIAPPPRPSASERLEVANAAAAKLQETQPQRVELTETQKKWADRFGAVHALDLVNEFMHEKKKK